MTTRRAGGWRSGRPHHEGQRCAGRCAVAVEPYCFGRCDARAPLVFRGAGAPRLYGRYLAVLSTRALPSGFLADRARGSVAATWRERHGGPPYFWFAEIKTPAAGSWHATLAEPLRAAGCPAAAAARAFREAVGQPHLVREVCWTMSTVMRASSPGRRRRNCRAIGVALYQQRPAPETGNYFCDDWFRSYVKSPERSTLNVYGGSDYAVTADGGDYTAHAVVGVDPENRMYLLDLWRGQTSSDQWIEAWCDLVCRWKPLFWAEERGQIISGIGPYLQRGQSSGQFVSRGDTATRAQSFRGRMAMLGLYVPTRAPWYPALRSELLSFPAGKYDDQVDALGLIGQLLDRITAGQRPKKLEEKKLDPYRPFDDVYDLQRRYQRQFQAPLGPRWRRAGMVHGADCVAAGGRLKRACATSKQQLRDDTKILAKSRLK
jgi:predicted phage terminase large subunit-like protein